MQIKFATLLSLLLSLSLNLNESLEKNLCKVFFFNVHFCNNRLKSD